MAVTLKSVLSDRLVGRSNVKEYGDKIKELKEVAGNVTENGALMVMFVDQSERYLPATKVVGDLMDLKYLYNNRSLQSNPKLAEEFGEVIAHVKAIEKIISKRRKKLFQKRNERQQQKEENVNE